MDCTNYIDLLSAHADGELTAEERREAEAHLATCATCRALFEEERGLKAVVQGGLMGTPPHIRARVRAALDVEDAAATESNGHRLGRAIRDGGTHREERAGRAPERRSNRRRRYLWAPVVVAAAALALFIAIGRHTPPPAGDVPEFDQAIAAYEQYQQHFEPNVPSDSVRAVSTAYAEHSMPPFLWHFWREGYPLIGGRIDHLPAGQPVAYTLYRNDTGAILCEFAALPTMKAPPGEVSKLGVHTLYRYRGYSIAFTPAPFGDCICILVSRQSPDQFAALMEACETGF